ncbi:type II toxin-antitoxin system HicA family toxin [Natronoglomus mannanivorans]|uniref:Type II toxin-antitoxin system HicA family toxin n=1 Tax=Natronoglomus mannanivorans TaxID=2979990 RepID=A0AAP2Z331_9EURY|nr:type II toxin-antitoxin system HicA family toxin [Halobacteria archaeon AArc-xg1-1]
MVRTSFSGREIAKVLQNHGFRRSGRTGSHLKLRYEHPETDEVRVVTVPMKSEDEIPTGTLKSIANQCGADDFHAWCEWIDQNR